MAQGWEKKKNPMVNNNEKTERTKEGKVSKRGGL